MDRTVRVKLNTTPEQAYALKETLAKFTNAFNAVCEYGWQNTERNGVRLHHETYYPIKAQCPSLVSDLIIQARVKATETIKSAFTRQKQGRAVSQPHSQLCAARYNLHTYKVYWPKAEVSLSTTQGRMRIGFTVPPYAYALRYIGNPTATADLLYRKGSFWLHIVVSLKDSEFVASEQVIGVDLGLNRPAVTSGRAFLGKRAWKGVDKRYFRLKRALQSKGSKSARRHLRKLAGKQLRFHRDCDHVLSKRIVQSAIPGATIVVENLTDIRQRARFRRGEGQRRLHAWSFRQLRSFLEYKTKEAGMCVVAIDPRHTSQTCSNCGFQHRSNRRSQSLFLCRSCGYSLNADLNASRNIRDKHLVALGIPLGYGPPSRCLSSQAPA